MVYFVRKQDSSSSGADPYFVRRRNNPQSFPSDTDSSINWKETLFLNLLVNHCIYTIVVMVVAQKKGEWQTISKISQVVNALPSASRMDAKAEETSLVYPLMYAPNFEAENVIKICFSHSKFLLVFCLPFSQIGTFPSIISTLFSTSLLLVLSKASSSN